MAVSAQQRLSVLVLLDDPLVDVRDTTVLRAVAANDRYYDRTMLNRLR